MRIMAPVIVFAYNRPDHLRQTLEHLANAEGAADSNLWIFCDGPKPAADLVKINAVSALARDTVWESRFASVQVETSRENKGLARSIIEGVSAVIETAGRAIIVEDDLLVSPDFLRFMNDCLEFYQNNQKVGSVTAFSPFTKRPKNYRPDIIALPRNCSHGWATWIDRWREIDWDAPHAIKLWHDSSLRSRFNSVGNDRMDRLYRQLAGKIDSWSIRFGLWQTLSGRHTIYPVHNRVRNIGFDGSGIHTRKGQEVNSNSLETSLPYRLEPVAESPDIIRCVARIYAGAWYRPVLRDLRTWLRARRTL